MNVLWFTGVQLPAVTGADLNRAGWQEGLRRALYRSSPDIKISIASFGSEPYQPLQVENATYYNIFREGQSGNRWQRMMDNWKHRSFDQEELSRILEIYKLVQPDLVFIFGTENPFGLLAHEFSVPSVISIQAVINGLVQNLFYGFTGRQLIRNFSLERRSLDRGSSINGGLIKNMPAWNGRSIRGANIFAAALNGIIPGWIV